MKRACCHLWKTVTTHVTEQQLKLIHGKRKSCLGRSWYSSQRVIHQQQTPTTTTTTDDKTNSSTSHSSSTKNTNTSSTITFTPSTSAATLATASAASTSAASPTAAAANTDLLRAAVLHSERPRVLFPWRHELDPLPRFVASSNNQVDVGGRTGVPPLGLVRSPYGDWMVSAITRAVAINGLGIPLHKILGNAWMDDFANSSAWAFSQAVTGVLSSAYHVSNTNNNTSTDDFPVNFDSNNNNNDNNTDEFPDLSNMLDERLLKQYQAASEYGRDQIRVQLQMKPVMAQLDNMFGVPFLTRAEVREHPELQHQFFNLLTSTEFMNLYARDGVQSFMNIYRYIKDKSSEIITAQMERRGEPIMSSTIVAQVFVGCEEVFSVRDVHTDALLQGDVDGLTRPVLHLVRLERVVEYNLGTEQWQLGQWIITDWDDLLDGNIWFL